MITGLVIFLCIAVCCLVFYLGYLAGVNYIGTRATEAWINAMFDCGIDSEVIEKVIDRTKEIFFKNIKGE